jgi:multidrug efflux pump subunit AcrA (membrane-fusion protein)
MTRLSAVLCLIWLFLPGLLPPAVADESAARSSEGAQTDPASSVETDISAESVKLLVDEVQRLRVELQGLRKDLAEARLRAAEAEREFQELRQFVSDHEALGDDFQQYRAIKAIAEREARQRQAEAARRQREQEQAARRARYEAAREQRRAEQAEQERLQRYHDAGFSSLGLDVFVGRTAFYYNTIETNPVRIDWDPLIGKYYRPYGPRTRIDFSEMTVSGSVLNAAEEVRNIGIAVTFFDESGSQVGGEIIQINNARPDVPYPFTAKVAMALDRPFDSSSTYVLYADPIQSGNRESLDSAPPDG